LFLFYRKNHVQRIYARTILVVGAIEIVRVMKWWEIVPEIRMNR